MKIITVTHNADLHQLLLQAASLLINWKDPVKKWDIIIEDREYNTKYNVQKWCNDTLIPLMVDWEVTIILPEINYDGEGWVRQQLLKLYYGAHSSEEWSLILDCKNFLIKPASSKSFFIDGAIKHLPVLTADSFTLGSHKTAREILGITTDTPEVANMTPWVWNTTEVKALVDKLNINLDFWPFGEATEFSLYWQWTYNKFKWFPEQNISGYWEDIQKNYKELITSVKDNPSLLFWALPRRQHNFLLVTETLNLLRDSGISETIIEEWKEMYLERVADINSTIVDMNANPNWDRPEKKLWAYGDSFVAGDLDIPGRLDYSSEYSQENKYIFSFSSILAKRLGLKLINNAVSGSGNYPQLDKLWNDAPMIKPDDLVLFGLTTPWRDRFQLTWLAPDVLNNSKAPALVDRALLKNDDENRIAVSDMFYILSVIEKIESLYGFTVITFNAFHNPLAEKNKSEKLQKILNIDKQKFKFRHFLGQEIENNTLLDVLSDTWGKEIITRKSDHSKWLPPIEYQHFFTAKSHPSKLGHQKIADWLFDEIKNGGLY